MNSEPLYHTTRSGTTVARCATIGFAVLFLLAALPAMVFAADITGTSRTYVVYRETPSDRKLAPLYEYLDFNVQDLGKETISVHFGGWLGYDRHEDSFGQDKKTGNDLQYGYVSIRPKEHNATMNLGRVMVFEGVAAERIDGVYARTDIQGGFGIAAFGGASVETEVDSQGDNTIYGARLSHQAAGLYTIGLSYLKQEKNSLNVREEEGLDLWLRPINKVELMGRSAYNAETTGWMEHAYYLMLGPFDKLRLNTEATRINYADYFAGSTSKVFTMTPGGALDPKEKVDILGEEIFFAIDKNWSVSADYKKFGYAIAGSADYYGARATYSLPKAYSAGVSVHKMEGGTNRLKYDEYRIYASKKIHKLDVAVDLLDVKYNEAINDVTSAYSATLAAGYELTEKLKIGLDVEYSKNPDFDKDVRLFAKLTYNLGGASASRKPAAGQEKQKAIPEQVTPAAPPAPEQSAPKAAPEAVIPAIVPAPDQSAPTAASEPVAPAAAAPEQVTPGAPVEQAGTPGGTEQGKPKEGKE